MSGRGARGYSGGRSNSGRGGRGRGRGQSYTGAGTAAKKGLCTTLGTNVFDYGQKNVADQMRTTWEKLVQHVGTSYGQDISNELMNKTIVNIVQPTHTASVLARHQTRELMIRAGQQNILRAQRTRRTALELTVRAGADDEAPMKLAILENQIAQGEFAAGVDVPIELTDSEKTLHTNEW